MAGSDFCPEIAASCIGFLIIQKLAFAYRIT